MIESNLNPPAINHVIPLDCNQAVNRLYELSKQADGLVEEIGVNRFERIQLACGLLADRKWLRDHKMDEAKAIEYLERKYFADLADIISLTKLREIYRWQSERVWWQEHRYNFKIVNKLHEDYLFWIRQKEHEGEERPEPPKRFVLMSEFREVKERLTDDVKQYRSMYNNQKKEVEKRDETIKNLAHTVQTVKEQEKQAVQQCRSEVEELRAENQRLKKENTQLKKQLQEIQQQR